MGIFGYPHKIRFGTGNKIVAAGHFKEQPAVFITDAEVPGKIGENAAGSQDLDSESDWKYILIFPTEEQAKAVSDSLVGIY